MQAVTGQIGDVLFSDCLSEKQRCAMEDAADMVLECQRALSNTGTNIIGELLRFTDNFHEWDHVPEKDVHDPNSRSQYYYHAHPKGANNNTFHDNEHGHFHLFMRTRDDESGKSAMAHIIGISMDSYGLPVKLFTTNKWVTGETWHKAEDMVAMLGRFEIDHTQPSWPVNLWVTNMVILFRPQIETLLKERDKAVEKWAREHPEEDVYEDRTLEITSWRPINLERQIAALAASF